MPKPSKRRSPDNTIAAKRQLLVRRTALALGVDEAAAQALLAVPRRQSLRLNPLAGEPQATLAALRELGWQGGRFAWLPEGYTADAGLEAVRDSPLVAEGRAYIQNAASWLPVLALDARPGERVLDVCAAPGGKTTHLAARAANRAVITANDNSRVRLAKLRATCQRMTASIERYTLYDARQLAYRLAGEQFDKVLLDAPCSGEGLLRLDHDKDFQYWSVAQIKRLQQLQRKLLAQAWQLLRPGGRLVYSTCTMAPEENEAVISYALRTLEDAQLQPFTAALPNRVAAVRQWHGKALAPEIDGCLRLQPSRDVEAFFVAVLTKSATSDVSA